MAKTTAVSGDTSARARTRRPSNEGRDVAGAVSLGREPGARATSGVVKRSVSLDADLDRELTERFGRGGKSRFLNAAARDALARVLILELLAGYDREAGQVADDVHDEVARLPRPE